MRWFGVCLIVVALLILVGWYNSENIAKRILDNQLPAFGFELRELKLSSPLPSGVRVAHFDVGSESMDVEIDQMDLTPLPDGEFHLAIERVLVTLNREVAKVIQKH